MNVLSNYSTPFESYPFTQFSTSDIKKGMMDALDISRQNVEAILQNEDTPTFTNTIVALESAAQELAKASHLLFNLNSAETNDEIQKIAQEISPLISDYQSFVSLHPALYEKIKYVYDTVDRSTLSEEEQRYLELRYKSCLRSGVNLPEKEKETLKSIDKKLAQLGLQFGENVLKATNAYHLHITQPSRLEGLPKSAIDMAQEEAEKRELSGWVFTLQYPSLLPVLKFAKDRELRKELSFANAAKNFQNNTFNNASIVQEIVSLRKERAQLLNYDSYSSFVLEERMAKSTEEVNHFLQDLLKKAKPFAQEEIAELQKMAAQDGIENMMGYDHAYYAEKRKEELFQYTDEETRPYFELSKVKDASFFLAQTLFGFEFIPRDDIEVYHPEVEVYEVQEKGQYKALLYLDFFPRAGKRPGAWMTSFKDQYQKDHENIRPQVSVVCNFTRPTKDTPSLLSFSEVTTLFHEMGHALHGICANTEYAALSGTSVLWDFVELPSQFLENYCYEAEFLRKFALHYQTQESISEGLLQKIKDSSNFMEGYQTVRQLSFGMLDMAYHSSDIPMEDSFDPESFEKEAMKSTQMYPTVEGSCFSTSFSHIFAGGYASGYYSYKWAEVLEADAFAFFKENGIFDKAIAQKFKTLLAAGGTVAPEVLYENFRGKPASNTALLKRAGLIST